MFHSYSSRQAFQGHCRPATTSAVVFTSIALLTIPLSAQSLEMDHESITKAPIEIQDPITGALGDLGQEDAIVAAPAEPLVEAASEETLAETETVETTGDDVSSDAFADSPEIAEPAADSVTKIDQDEIEVAAVPPHGETDIYDQWSRKKVSRRRKQKPHPLAAAHPDHFVVVCQGGCAKEQVHVVYLERRDARGPVSVKPLKAGIVAGTESIDCVGGCYQAIKSYASVVNADVASDENGWVTNVKKAQPGDPKAKSGDRWYDRMK